MGKKDDISEALILLKEIKHDLLKITSLTIGLVNEINYLSEKNLFAEVTKDSRLIELAKQAKTFLETEYGE